MKLINKLLAFAGCCLAIGLSSCNPTKTTIQILMSSDIHGMLLPYDYALDTEVSKTGSLSQIGSVINKYKNDNTLVIDCGDAIQGNYSDIFVDKDKMTIHPMIEALNKLKYDVFVTGNHEYNYGMDYLQKQLSYFNGTALTGNVIKKGTYEPLADSYKIFNKGGIKVAVIGMTSPLITRWDGEKLTDWNVTDPINETKKIVKVIKDNNLADVIVAAEHLGIPKEYGAEGTSCVDLANACPDIDVILGAHEHKLYEKQIVNGVLICENAANAKTMMKVDIDVNKGFAIKPKVTNKDSVKINVGEFKTDSVVDEYAKPFDAKAKKEARTEIGELTGTEPMSKEFEIKKVPSTFMEPTPLVNIVNKVQLDVAQEDCVDIKDKIKVAATAMGNYTANLTPGKIRKCDCSNIYKYTNTLYVLKMNKAQLKKYMEWTAQFYQGYVDKDLTIAFVDNITMPLFNYDMFYGVKYDINIAKSKGERIENLTWEDGSEIDDDEEFYIAVNNYRANTNLLAKGTVYDDKDVLPTLYKGDLKQGKGIREMLVDFITTEKTITAEQFKSENWKITGTNWDEAKHNIAVDGINNGIYDIGDRNTKKVTEDDIKS